MHCSFRSGSVERPAWKVTDHEAEWPEDFFEQCRATLLYAIMPYDLSFWGVLRRPLLFSIYLLFLFPLYGVDSICVIVLWIYTYKVDEYQLTDFIIKSKGLQFITSGLISGALAFFKMYKCSIQEEGSPLACEHKAPGMLPTFPFEFSLLLVRTVLVWITFLILWNFDAVTAWHARRRAKAATSDARRTDSARSEGEKPRSRVSPVRRLSPSIR